MTRPRPTPEGLTFYYEGAYSDGTEAPGEIDMRGFHNNAGTLLNKNRTATIEKVRMPGPEDRVLDVGCSRASCRLHASAGTAPRRASTSTRGASPRPSTRRTAVT